MTTPHRILQLTLGTLAMVFTATTVLAQQAVTRVEGFIRDESSSVGIGVKIYVYPPNGKRLTISSNSADGSYLVVLNDPGAHRFVMAGHNVYRKEYTVDVPSSTKFQEIKRDFTVKELREGAQLISVVGFDKNGAVLSGGARSALAKLKEDLQANQQMNVVITVTADEDRLSGLAAAQHAQFAKDSAAWAKSMKAYEKKYKKAKTKPEPPVAPVPPSSNPEDPNIQLLKDRVTAVKAEMADVKNGDLRVVVKEGTLPAGTTSVAAAPIVEETSAKKSKTAKKPKKTPAAAAATQQPVGPKHHTLVAVIGPVKRLFAE